MTKTEMMHIVRTQLAIDLNCTPEDFLREKDSFVFCKIADNAGRRPFPRDASHFEMLTLGGSIVVSATEDLLDDIRTQLHGKTRDDAFTQVFVYGHSMYYLPDVDNFKQLPAPPGFEYETVQQPDVAKLYKYKGFRDAIWYEKHARPETLVMVAYKDGEAVGMAGASDDCTRMWQIGIDVNPEQRGNGLAAYLVNSLARQILQLGYVPYYGTASSNIASQRTAHRAGFMPAWMCAYRGWFNGVITAPTS